MRAIWKFPLVWGGSQDVEMPKGATVLTVQKQGMVATIWAIVDPLAAKERRTFKVMGTGWQFDPDGLHYLATWQDGEFVWHLFEQIGAREGSSSY
jgi:hypothetical protein